MILPIEKQHTSLKPSKRLRELGVRQDSAYRWEHIFNDEWQLFPDNYNNNNEFAAAPSVAELGELLPKGCKSQRAEGGFFTGLNLEYSSFDLIEADARAKMLIYLIENDLLTDEQREKVMGS